MKLLQTLENINDKLGKLLDRMSEETVHTKQGEGHTARTVSSPAREMTTTIKLDATQAQKTLDMLSNTVSKIKDKCTGLQECDKRLTNAPKEQKPLSYVDRMIKERDGLIGKYLKLSDYLSNHKKDLSEKEIELMSEQYKTMFKYSEILYKRISIALSK